MNDITSVVETTLARSAHSRRYGREYTGPCPWCAGDDRFHVWPYGGDDIPGVGNLGRFQCMGSAQGRAGCGRSGDIVSYVEQRRNLDFGSACRELGIDPLAIINYRREQRGQAPVEHLHSIQQHEPSLSERSGEWQKNAYDLARWASSQFTHESLGYLRQRGINNSTIKGNLLGFYPRYKRVDASLWGAKSGAMCIPCGIIIPWFDERERIICMRIRRLPNDESKLAREVYGVDGRTGEIRRYKVLYGSSSRYLYKGHFLTPGCNVALFEGELDALIASQQSDDCACVAAGSTSWGRSSLSLRRLAASKQVLICFDNDENSAGDRGAKYWTENLNNSCRWRPLWNDASDMARDGMDLGKWLSIGLSEQSVNAPTSQPVEDYSLEWRSDTCCICGQEVERYDENGIPYCEKCWTITLKGLVEGQVS